MLGKLIKYEWKSTGRMGGLVLLIMAAATLLAALGAVLPLHFVMRNAQTSGADSMLDIVAMFFVVICCVLYFCAIMGVSYGIMIYLGIHFYKTMYTDEGYLTQTLPVSAHQLLVSKILVSGIWEFIVGLCILVSVALLGGLVAVMEMGSPELFQLLGSVWEEFVYVFQTELGLSAARMVITLIIMWLTMPFAAMIQMFGGITIGQLASKYKALMGILAYFGVLAVNGIVSYFIQFVTSFGSVMVTTVTGDYSPNVTASWNGSIVLNLFMGTLMYFISYHIITRKLNMD